MSSVRPGVLATLAPALLVLVAGTGGEDGAAGQGEPRPTMKRWPRIVAMCA